MGQKDLAVKDLESKPEVFADIINAFIFNGDQVVSAENLKPAPTETLYESTYEMLRNQYNDVSKYEMAGQEVGIQYVLENESKRNSRLIYTLFFEDARIAAPVRDFVDNIELHIFSMAHLPKEIRQRFKSDMRIVVDYLAEGANYEPTTHKIKYVEPVMRLLYALTGEKEYLNSIAELVKKQEKGEVTMCEVVDKFVARGIKQGIQQAIPALIETCIEFGSTKEETVERIVKKMQISNDEAELYVSKYW